VAKLVVADAGVSQRGEHGLLADVLGCVQNDGEFRLGQSDRLPARKPNSPSPTALPSPFSWC
jgi:hypothetical protein